MKIATKSPGKVPKWSQKSPDFVQKAQILPLYRAFEPSPKSQILYRSACYRHVCLTLSPLVPLTWSKVFSPGMNNPRSEEPIQSQKLNVGDPALLYLWLSYRGPFKNIAYVGSMGNFDLSCICALAHAHCTGYSITTIHVKSCVLHILFDNSTDMVFCCNLHIL